MICTYLLQSLRAVEENDPPLLPPSEDAKHEQRRPLLPSMLLKFARTDQAQGQLNIQE